MKYCSDIASKKIKILSFLATISVVIIHTNALESNREVPIAWWIGNFIGYAQRWAVPFFFVVSGFFLHRVVNAKVHFSICDFLKKRVKTLLIPYLCWGAVYGTVTMTPLLYVVAIVHKASSPLSHTVFTGGVWHTIDCVVGITCSAPPNGALWYLRMLILITFTSPLWLWIFSRTRWLGIVISLLLICLTPLSVIDEVPVEITFLKLFNIDINAIGWVFLGITISVLKLEVIPPRRGVVVICVVLWATLTFLPLPFKYLDAPVSPCVRVLHRVAPIMFIIVFWRLVDWFEGVFPQKLFSYSGLGFWIYCMHHPITGYVSAGFHMLLGYSIYESICYQAVGWIVVLGICTCFYFIIQKRFPRTFVVLTGGRAVERQVN